MRMGFWLLMFGLNACSGVQAQPQPSASVVLQVGEGPGQVGLVRSPNAACRGPSVVAAASQDRVAVLDVVNHKILVVGRERVDVPLPVDLSEPLDLVSTTAGYLVVDARGTVVHVAEGGNVLYRTSVPHRPQEGDLRFLSLRDGRLALESLSRNRIALDVGTTAVGDLLLPGNSAGGQYEISRSADARVMTATSTVTIGALSTLLARSSLRIQDARVVWVQADRGALVAVQETQRFPQERSFLRLVSYGAEGRSTGETYVDGDAFACEARRPFVRTQEGRVVALVPKSGNTMEIQQVAFADKAAPPVTSPATSGIQRLSGSDNDVLSALERMNGTSSATSIGLNQVSRATIIERARQALNLRWTLTPANYEQIDVPNRCAPPSHVWTRPHRLDGRIGEEIVGIPYHWGGYIKTLAEFQSSLAAGKLAGSVCTCRDANCVTQRATGQDCSGFVSYAWDTGRYYTTRSLPKPEVSKLLASWDEVKPGDIVNIAGSHVRLVISVTSPPGGWTFQTIESTTRRDCGGVCDRSYSEAEMRLQGYKPYRRIALKD